MLANAGVEHFFLLTGGDNAFLSALARNGIAMVLARSERSAAFMADAYSRLRGQPSFVYGQFGPGAAVVLSGLVDSTLANTPVVALVSDTKTDVIYSGAYQELDQLALFRPIVKWAARVERGDRAPDLLRAAIRNAVTGCPGPTYLGVPSDLLLSAAFSDGESDYLELTRCGFLRNDRPPTPRASRRLSRYSPPPSVPSSWPAVAPWCPRLSPR